MTIITRVEIITDTGRDYVNWEEDNDITLSYQDDGRTLKVFVNTMKPKSPAEKAYYAVYGWYPPTTSSVSNYEDNRWRDFQNGYNASQVIETPQEPEEPETLLDVIRNLGYSVDMCYEIVDAVEEFEKSKEPEKWDVVRESVKWCEEHPNESVEDYLKPHTPEKTEKSLREAFVKAQQTEKWKETQRKIDEEDNDKNFKNSLDLIREWGEKNKPPTLYQLIEDWWCDIFCANSMDDMETCIDGLVDRIDKKFIPPSIDRNGYEWEKCLKIMREKLR